MTEGLWEAFEIGKRYEKESREYSHIDCKMAGHPICVRSPHGKTGWCSCAVRSGPAPTPADVAKALDALAVARDASSKFRREYYARNNVMVSPSEPGHVHDTDAGGNCRNPACDFNSDWAYNEGMDWS